MTELREKAKEEEQRARDHDGNGEVEARDRALQRAAIYRVGYSIASELELIFGILRNRVG